MRRRCGRRRARERGLRLSSVRDGPFVVTHLVFWAGGGPRKASAVLPKPLLIIDSGGAEISAAELKRLKWVDWSGTPVPTPPPGARLAALYYRPLSTR